jgi:Ca2+-binding EF-hand superfamily protein
MRILVLSLLALTSAAEAQISPKQPITVTGHNWAPFISPMGEPFRARTATDDTLARWFTQADRNHDGVLTPDEMVADAERFFATLDTNHDGEIDPDELAKYEWDIAPDIQVMAKTRRGPGGPAPTAQSDDPLGAAAYDRPRQGRRRDTGDELDGSLAIDGALQGAARYSLLNIPEPVAAADTDFNRLITLEEFKAAALERFQLLDTAHQGRLTLAQLEAMRPSSDGRRPKRKRDAPDARIGNPLPPGP